MNYSERLKTARKQAGLTQADLARQVGIDQTSISNLERGKSQGSSHTVSIAHACGVSPLWLESGEGPMVEDHVAFKGPVPDGYKATRPFSTWDMDSPLADDEVFLWFLEEDRDAPQSVLKGGCVIPAGFAVSKTRKMRFDRQVFERQNISPEMAVCVEVRGNSMDPVLPSGSVVAVNTRIVDADDGRMYALAHRGKLRVKLMHSLPDYAVRLRSYNRDEHPDEDYPLTETLEGRLKVIGRVFWYSAVI